MSLDSNNIVQIRQAFEDAIPEPLSIEKVNHEHIALITKQVEELEHAIYKGYLPSEEEAEWMDVAHELLLKTGNL